MECSPNHKKKGLNVIVISEQDDVDILIEYANLEYINI
jgi:hypothetical protein